MNEYYSTKEIAQAHGIHVNTVRFYEKIGFITKPERKANGYRIYTGLHMQQCSLIRLAMRSEVLQNGLRKKAVEAVRLCAAGKPEESAAAVREYRNMARRELEGAKKAARAVENRINGGLCEYGDLKRKDAAAALQVTPETLRTWERNGLIGIKRKANGYRIYSGADMERLCIIRTLRCAGYSLAAILRLLDRLDTQPCCPVEAALNTPGSNEEIVSACDRLTESLKTIISNADAMLLLLAEFPKIPTLQ